MSIIKLLFTGILVFISGLSSGQIKEFQWEELGVRGSFDSTKYSEKELKDTYSICYPGYGNYGIDGVYATNMKEAKKLSEQKINRQYTTAYNRLEDLQVIEMNFAIIAKNCAQQDIKRHRDFSIDLIRVYKNPRRYRKKSSLDSCSKYIDLIFVDDKSLIKKWFSVSMDRCKRNSNPEECLDNLYYSHLDSRKKNEIARFAIINHYYRECIRSRYLGGCATQCFDEFKKLFITFDRYNY